MENLLIPHYILEPMAELLETEYTITPGTLVKGMTAFVIIIFIVIGIVVSTSILFLEEDFMAFLFMIILLPCVFIPILAGAWVYSPQKYFVSENKIKIVRPVNTITIPISKITNIEDKEINAFKTIRLWANGGLFSFTGTFYNKADGKFQMHAKNNRYIMIHADNKYVLSPDDKEQFIIQVKNNIGRHEKKKCRNEEHYTKKRSKKLLTI